MRAPSTATSARLPGSPVPSTTVAPRRTMWCMGLSASRPGARREASWYTGRRSEEVLVLRPRVVRSSSNINLWRTPLWLSLGSVALFSVTMIPDVLEAFGIIHLPMWLTMGGIDDARAILGAMLSCVSTVLALIFSVALLVLSMVATLFGPRLLYRFLQDWVTQFTIGLFMASFIYLCLVFLVTHQDANSTFIPQISLITSWFLVVASFAFLVYYSHRIAISIQNPDMVARIGDDLQSAFLKYHTPGIGGRA